MSHETVSAPGQMHYELRLTTTASGVGYFACCPVEERFFNDFLQYLRTHPLDEFMHKHLMESLAVLNEEKLRDFIEKARPDDPVFLALLYEVCGSYEKFAALRSLFDAVDLKDLSSFTPLIHIRSNRQTDQPLHFEWIGLLEKNVSEHQALPHPARVGLPFPFGDDDLAAARKPSVPVQAVMERAAGSTQPQNERVFSLEETSRRALERLEENGVTAGSEMRHVASLSPYALFRRWNLNVAVRNGRHDYTLTGIQTSYGRGLSLAAARASYSMEIVERCSSFAAFGPEGVLGYAREYPLSHASHRELAGKPTAVLDPNALRLEVPYENEMLYWLQGERVTGDGMHPILIPAQCVFLFCNLDEINLFSGLGSTGLAAGNSMEQAKVSALLEVLERDAEGVTVYDPSRCFRLEAHDPVLSPLLSDYRAKGIHIQFQEMSSPLGIPCYKCFVVTSEGDIIKGTGAHLDGRRAVISALTETPYPYPYSPPSAPAPEGLPVVRLEELPNHSRGNYREDLALLEKALTTNGYHPIYVDLTRRDLEFPVVRAIVPGMEFMTDFDRFSRVSPRLFCNYLNLFQHRD